MRKQTPDPFSKIIACIVCCLILISFPRAVPAVEKDIQSPLSIAGLTDEEFETRIKQYVGIPYRRGGTSTNGMDCSGFVKRIYERLFGIDLPHGSLAQFRFPDLEKIDTREMQTGDLIFFSNGRKKRVDHVGVYLSDNRFIHASSSNGIKVSSLNNRYWKKRVVGSKRYALMNPEQDENALQIETSFEIPIHEKGLISSYRRDEINLNSLGVQTDTDIFRRTTPGMDTPSISPLHFHEIGYGYSLVDGIALRLSAIHQTFSTLSVWPDDETVPRSDWTWDSESMDIADRKGLRLAGDIRPSDWLRISPSITYFDYSRDDMDILNAPEWLFGLNTVLLPIHKRWSLSMLLQYSTGDGLNSLVDPQLRYDSVDMAVRLGINLTDKLKFSITGEHDLQKARLGTPGDSLIMRSENSNLSMSFDFSY